MFSEKNDHIELVLPDGTVVYEYGYDPTRYCDMYYCYECPRFGDECDGKEENRMEKKKSTPEGALISNQDHSTTPGEKSEAQILFDRIKTGREHALKVPNRFTEFRELVAKANREGDCIINVGEGYYRPGADDEDELKHYLYRELHRANAIIDKVNAMKDTYYGRY